MSLCQDGDCVNKEGGFVCECPTGYVLSSDGKQCIDVREELCFNSYSRGICLDPRMMTMTKTQCCCTMGSSWGTACEECPPEDSGTSHTPTFFLSFLSFLSFLFFPLVKRLFIYLLLFFFFIAEFLKLCPSGSGRGPKGEDLNECNVMPGVCDGGECVNTDGSFRCECPMGFVLDDSGHKCVGTFHVTPSTHADY